MIDFGETFTSNNFEVRDSAGALAVAGTVTATITLPDATTTNPTVANPSNGIYNFDYLTTQAGRHTFIVTATGGVLGSLVRKFSDTFEVASVDPGFIISLADGKKQLNITTTIHDEELRGWLSSITNVVESNPDFGVGPVVRRTITERHHQNSTTALVLRRPPVISLTSITAVLNLGTSYATTDVTVDGEAGIVLRKDGAAFIGGPWDVIYVAGRVTIQPNITHAGRIILQHVWETQRYSDFRRPPIAVADAMQIEDQSGRAFSIPRRAVELLSASSQPFGFA